MQARSNPNAIDLLIWAGAIGGIYYAYRSGWLNKVLPPEVVPGPQTGKGIQCPPFYAWNVAKGFCERTPTTSAPPDPRCGQLMQASLRADSSYAVPMQQLATFGVTGVLCEPETGGTGTVCRMCVAADQFERIRAAGINIYAAVSDAPRPRK